MISAGLFASRRGRVKRESIATKERQLEHLHKKCERLVVGKVDSQYSARHRHQRAREEIVRHRWNCRRRKVMR